MTFIIELFKLVIQTVSWEDKEFALKIGYIDILTPIPFLKDKYGCSVELSPYGALFWFEIDQSGFIFEILYIRIYATYKGADGTWYKGSGLKFLNFHK